MDYSVESYPHYSMDNQMKTIQMTIDEDLLIQVDQVTQSLQTTRSAFIRAALHLALQQHAMQQRERQHADGYARHPIQPGEFDDWEAEQSWGAA